MCFDSFHGTSRPAVCDCTVRGACFVNNLKDILRVKYVYKSKLLQVI